MKIRISELCTQTGLWIRGLSPRTVLILSGLGSAGGVAALYASNPDQVPIYPNCIFHRLTGLDCPGCGATRAAFALVHGDLFTAWRDNALFLSALPVLAWATAPTLWQIGVRNRWPVRPRPSEQSRISAGAILLLLLIGFGVLRNLPGFEILRPVEDVVVPLKK